MLPLKKTKKTKVQTPLKTPIPPGLPIKEFIFGEGDPLYIKATKPMPSLKATHELPKVVRQIVTPGLYGL